jgi:hypothetical protein
VVDVATGVGPTVGGGTTPVSAADGGGETDTETAGGPSSWIGVTGRWRGRSNAIAAPTPSAPTTASAATAIVPPDRFTRVSGGPAPNCDTSWRRR